MSYTESSRSFELWTQHHANYIFSAYVREWHNGGHEGAAKQAMDAAKFIADRLANIKVRKPSLKALLHRAPTTTEVEKDTEAYMRFCRATDMSGLAGLEVASHLAAEFVGKDSMEEGFELDLHWAADIWDGAGNGDLVDYSVFINEHVAPAIAKLIDVDFELARHEANVTKVTCKGRVVELIIA